MAVQNELGFHALMWKDIYGILLKKTNNIYDMILFCKKADPSSSQFHVYIERQDYEGIHYSAFQWFPLERGLGAGVGEGLAE